MSGLSVLAEAFRLAGRLEEAGHAVEEGLELARGNANALPLLYQTRAFIRRDAGRSEEATRDFELTREALAEHRCRDDPEWLKSIHGNLGQLYYDAGDYSRAAAAYRQLLRWYPEADASQAAVLNVLGQCHNGLGEYAEARHYFEAVLAAPSVSGESRVAAERDLLSASAHQARVSGDHEQAAALFGRMLDHHPDDVTERHHVLLWLGHSLYAAQRYEEALLRYEEVASSPRAEPDDRAQAEEWARWSTGRIRHAAGELAEAAETFGRLVDTYPEDHSQRCNALLWLAACYRYLGAAAGARERYEAILTAPTATGSERTSARQGLAEADQSG